MVLAAGKICEMKLSTLLQMASTKCFLHEIAFWFYMKFICFGIATNHIFSKKCYIVDCPLRFGFELLINRVVSQCLFNALNDKSRENDEMRACSKYCPRQSTLVGLPEKILHFTITEPLRIVISMLINAYWPNTIYQRFSKAAMN